MKIKQILEQEADSLLPDIMGEVIEIREPIKKGDDNPVMIQSVVIQDETGKIKLKLPEKFHLPTDMHGTAEVMGSKLHFVAGKKENGRIQGIKVIEYKGTKYVRITDAVTKVDYKAAKPKQEATEENEPELKMPDMPEGKADGHIYKFFDTRLYILARLSERNELAGKHAGSKPPFKEEELVVMATSCHIELSRQGIDPLPKSLKRPEPAPVKDPTVKKGEKEPQLTEKEKPKWTGVTPPESLKDQDIKPVKKEDKVLPWMKVPHPTKEGVKVGDYSIEKIMGTSKDFDKKEMPLYVWYWKSKNLDKPKIAAFRDAIGEMMKHHGFYNGSAKSAFEYVVNDGIGKEPSSEDQQKIADYMVKRFKKNNFSQITEEEYSKFLATSVESLEKLRIILGNEEED